VNMSFRLSTEENRIGSAVSIARSSNAYDAASQEHCVGPILHLSSGELSTFQSVKFPFFYQTLGK